MFAAMARRNSRGDAPLLRLNSRLKCEMSRKPAANAMSAIVRFRESRVEQITGADENLLAADVLSDRPPRLGKQLVHVALRAAKFSRESCRVERSGSPLWRSI